MYGYFLQCGYINEPPFAISISMTLAASDGSDQTALQVSAVLSEPSLVTSAISEVTQTVEPTVILVGWLFWA